MSRPMLFMTASWASIVRPFSPRMIAKHGAPFRVPFYSRGRFCTTTPTISTFTMWGVSMFTPAI